MQPTQVKDFTPGEAVLAVALELAKGSWKVALQDGRRERPAVHTVAHAQAAGRLAEAVQVVEATRRRWQLDAATPVVVIYEAGQDGFWIERALTGLGYAVKVVDPASLPVARRARECERLALAERQLKTLEAALRDTLPAAVRARIERLVQLRGVGQVGATRLVLELFWRDFSNRRQVGACVGLVPQPYDRGESRVDQGISKQGNRRGRALLIEMAWLWLRYQPDSAVARWFAQRTQGSGPSKRGKRIAIVAVARRLVIALWRYLEQGEIPEGAALKAA